MFFLKIILTISLLFLLSCNRNLTEEQKKEMWSKAQTTGAIIERSGTKFNSATNKEVALRDAETRLQTGGGLFKDGGISVTGLLNNDNNTGNVGTYGMPINTFLWKGALETISFMPLNSADPIGGTILTDWYSTTNNENERCKLNIFITGKELKTQNLNVTSFCQIFKDQKWVQIDTDPNDNIKLENAILNKAKKLRLQSS
tara:strand:+ start:92 stop:694 length:603 start_codon:yes stop_codon:yes gene_type:complete